MIKYPNGKPARVKRVGKPMGKNKSKKRGPGPEHRIQNDIIAALAMAGHHVWRINVGTVETKDNRRFSAGPPKGFPDLCGFRKSDGKMFFIEVKTKTGKRRPSQDLFAMDVAYSPIIYGVARSAEEALMIVTKGLNRTEDVK